MGRDPIPCRLGFPGPPRRGRGVSGISLGFPRLSRSKGQVGHVLLTRSPLHVRPRAVSSFDLHVLGTPPAFILSQDQTLRLRGGNRFPLKSDLGFGPRPPPVLRCALGPGFRSQESFAWLFSSSLFSIRFSRFCSILSDPAALVCFKRVRKYFTVSFLSCQELFSKFFEAVRRLLISLVLQERSVPRFPQTRVLYITRKVYVRQWVILQNLKLFCSDWQNPR